MVLTLGSSKAYAYTGFITEGRAGNPGFGLVGKDVHVPLIMRNFSSWKVYLAIQNTTSSQATVNLSFYYDPSLTPCTPNPITSTRTIPASGVLFLDTSDLGFLCDPYVGSLHIDSNQPVAVVSAHTKYTNA